MDDLGVNDDAVDRVLDVVDVEIIVAGVYGVDSVEVPDDEVLVAITDLDVLGVVDLCGVEAGKDTDVADLDVLVVGRVTVGGADVIEELLLSSCC